MAPEVQAAKLAELNNAYQSAKNNRTEAETRLRELQKIREQGFDYLKEIAISLNDPVLEQLRAETTAAKIERANLLQSYKEKHPKIKQMDLKLETLQQNLLSAISTQFQKLETDVKVLRTREQNQAEALEAFKKDAVAINAKRLEYSKLKN